MPNYYFDYLSSLNVELYRGLADLVDRSSLDTARGEDMPPTPIISPMSDLLAKRVLSSARLLARLELFPAFLESKFYSGKLLNHPQVIDKQAYLPLKDWEAIAKT